MGRTLEQHGIKRESGGFVKKAAACTKADLQKMVKYLYSTASCASDYQDALLLSLLWYLFGRASDLTFGRKQQLSIGAGGVFFIRFIRMKTSDEQALSLFPDDDFQSCPLLALALALVTQKAPSTALLSHLPARTKDAPVELTASIPLLELLDGCDAPPFSQAPAQPTASSTPSPAGIHALANRLLERVAGPAGVEEQLSSHSFRRGGAQHANACFDLSAQWLFDRGVWNMTTTNKAFAYVFNTPKEDHQVAKVLSGMAPKQTSVLPSLDGFDSSTQEEICDVSSKLFNASQALGDKAFNVCTAVRDVLAATLIRHYPLLLKTNPQAPAVATVERCAKACGVTPTNLLAWSQQLTRSTAQVHATSQASTDDNTKTRAAFEQQSALIERLIEVDRRLEARVESLEAAQTNKGETTVTSHRDPAKRVRDEDEAVPVKRRRRSKSVPLVDTWFAWYTATPRGWLSQNKYKKSDAKQLIAFMKLFLPNGFVLDETAPSYKDQVRQTGEQASAGLLAFLREQDVPSTGANAVLKAMRKLHRTGTLNEHMRTYQQQLTVERVVDPAPACLQATLAPTM